MLPQSLEKNPEVTLRLVYIVQSQWMISAAKSIMGSKSKDMFTTPPPHLTCHSIESAFPLSPFLTLHPSLTLKVYMKNGVPIYRFTGNLTSKP